MNRTADGYGPVVRVAGRLPLGVPQLIGERSVATRLRVPNGLEVQFSREVRRAIEPLLPVLLGKGAVILIGACLGHGDDLNSRAAALGHVKTRGVDAEFRYGVGVRKVGRLASTAVVGHSVDGPLIASHAAGVVVRRSTGDGV